MKMKFILAFSIISTSLYSEVLIPDNQCALIIASDTDYVKASEYAETKVDNKKYMNIYSTKNGRYAVSIGFLKDHEAKHILSKWKKSGRIPQDSFCAKPDLLAYEMNTPMRPTIVDHPATRDIDQEFAKKEREYQKTLALYKAKAAYNKARVLEEKQKLEAMKREQRRGTQQYNNSFKPTPFTPDRYDYSPNSNKSSGCSSDFDCGTGGRCVKKNYSSRGVCMTTVNKYGNKTYGTPSTSSYGVKMGNKGGCTGIMDCPIGFKCDSGTGSCIRRNF